MIRKWMPLYIGDYLSGTSHLRAALSGAYLHLIMHYWQKGGLPDDDEQLASIARMTPEEWEKARPVLHAFFEPGWRHPRIEKELIEAEAHYEKRAQAGRKGGEATRRRRGNAGSNARCNASGNDGGHQAAMYHPLPSPSEDPIHEEEILGDESELVGPWPPFGGRLQ